MTYMETLPGLNFTAIDFEAANSDRASACAVGITTVHNGIVSDTRSWLIRPYTGLETFDAYATRIHGIDADVLRRSYEIAGLNPPTNELRCTQTLARTALRLDKHKLHLVAEHLGLPEFEQHDAGADSLTCALIAIEIGRRRQATSIRDLYAGLGIG